MLSEEELRKKTDSLRPTQRENWNEGLGVVFQLGIWVLVFAFQRIKCGASILPVLMTGILVTSLLTIKKRKQFRNRASQYYQMKKTNAIIRFNVLLVFLVVLSTLLYVMVSEKNIFTLYVIVSWMLTSMVEIMFYFGRFEELRDDVFFTQYDQVKRTGLSDILESPGQHITDDLFKRTPISSVSWKSLCDFWNTKDVRYVSMTRDRYSRWSKSIRDMDPLTKAYLKQKLSMDLSRKEKPVTSFVRGALGVAANIATVSSTPVFLLFVAKGLVLPMNIVVIMVLLYIVVIGFVMEQVSLIAHRDDQTNRVILQIIVDQETKPFLEDSERTNLFPY